MRAEEGIPTPDEVIRDYVAENPGKSNREVADDLGVNRKTVDALAQNGQVDQNGPPSPDPDPEPPAPSWEPAGHLHPPQYAPEWPLRRLSAILKGMCGTECRTP